MYRGTTPTITINCDIDVSEFVTMWVTFRTQQLATYAPPKQVEVTKHLGDEGVDATDKVVCSGRYSRRSRRTSSRSAFG